MTKLKTFKGGCLCGDVRYEATAEPIFPHLCSCTVCRRWSGAPTVAWVEFPLTAVAWTGPGGEPRLFRSSPKTRRGFCPSCGSALCAIDDGYPNISLVIASLDRPNLIVPDAGHSYKSDRPRWWHPDVRRS
ncbi:MAG: GFA family protein [Inquilinaceae bacterium]